MRKRSLFILSTALIAILIAASCSSAPQQFYENGVSDEEYIAIALNSPEARAFLDQFPQAEILVDRSGKLAVDFRLDKHLVTTTNQTWEGIRLRVFIDPKTNQPAETFLQCDNKFIEDGLIQYLKHYAEAQSCP